MKSATVRLKKLSLPQMSDRFGQIDRPPDLAYVTQPLIAPAEVPQDQLWQTELPWVREVKHDDILEQIIGWQKKQGFSRYKVQDNNIVRRKGRDFKQHRTTCNSALRIENLLHPTEYPTVVSEDNRSNDGKLNSKLTQSQMHISNSFTSDKEFCSGSSESIDVTPVAEPVSVAHKVTVLGESRQLVTRLKQQLVEIDTVRKMT